MQDKLLELCHHHLNPQGVAFVSHDAYPYGHLRKMARDLMRYHTRGRTDPLERAAQARALLALLVELEPPRPNAYQRFLRMERDRLANAPDSYLVHECLADVSEPLAFHDFAERAAHHGLRYLTDAGLVTPALAEFPPPVTRYLERLDRLTREQYLDFLLGRAFRRTLLCLQEVDPLPEPSPERLRTLFLAIPPPDPDGEPPAGTEGSAATRDDPLAQAALALLRDAWPRWLSFDALHAAAHARLAGEAVVVDDAAGFAGEARALAVELLRALGREPFVLRASAPGFVTEVRECPRASRLARWQAAQGAEVVSSLDHECVGLAAEGAQLLCHLDGTHDRAALVDVLVRFVEVNDLAVQRDGQTVSDPDQVRAILRDDVERMLQEIAGRALLVG